MLQDLIFSCNVVVPIFLLIMLGYALTRIKLWDANFLEIANNLCFKCLLPVLLFYNVATANAVSSYAMARNYEADYDLAGEIITLGTLISIVTMFVFITLSKMWGWI